MMEEVKKLKSRIEELEYRLAILERYLELEGGIHFQDDTSSMQAMKINLKKDMKAKGYEVSKFKDRLFMKFYLKE